MKNIQQLVIVPRVGPGEVAGFFAEELRDEVPIMNTGVIVYDLREPEVGVCRLFV